MPNILLEINPFDGASFQAPSFDGSNHNEVSLDMGSVGSSLLNIAPLDYGDGVSSPAGAERPDPRTISNALSQQDEDTPSPQGLTNMVWAMGQFLDHDLSLTPSLSRQDALAAGETFDISIPQDDSYLNPQGLDGLVIPLQRSEYIEGTGVGSGNPRELPNEITAWIDGSNIYGSNDDRAALLRSFDGGRLKVSDGDYLPLDPGNNNDNPGPATELFIAGDVRANENVVLTSMHTLFVREHNRLADALAQVHPEWTDEQVFQRARQLNVAQLQNIVFNEYVPVLLGKPLDAYGGYDASIDAGISRTFSTAAFRFGHTMVSSEIARFDNDGEPIAQGNLNLADAFFPNTDLLKESGIDAVLRGSVSTLSQTVDSKVIDELRNLLFNFGGRFAAQDLKALNIQRGRDHGLADYNTIRESFGLERVTDFSQITSDPSAQTELETLYGTVDKVDAIVGLFAENAIGNAAFGETIAAVLEDQFTRLRDGDRFYYENVLSAQEINVIGSTSMADIIERNTDTRRVQGNVFSLKQDGTSGEDVLKGGLGHDTIRGGAGDDVVKGYFGNDHLTGGTGNDTLKGNAGDDKIAGEAGNDKVYGSFGHDDLSGGIGSDSLRGGEGSDTLIGGEGRDYLVGGPGDDDIRGGAGNDRVMGTSAKWGGANEVDILSGGQNQDRFILGSKERVFYAADGDQDFAEILDFDSNQDKLQLYGSRNQYSMSQTDGETFLYFEKDGGQELVAKFAGQFNLDTMQIAYR